jgi:general secretion pathway protein D
MTVRPTTKRCRPQPAWKAAAAIAALAAVVLAPSMPAMAAGPPAAAAKPAGSSTTKPAAVAAPTAAQLNPAPISVTPPAQAANPHHDATQDATTAGDSIVLNFENADIREVIYSLAVAMNINYWIDPRVQGQVTVRTAGKLSREDLWPIFHQLLRNNGFAAVKNGDLYSIVPAEEAKTRVITPGLDVGSEGHFVMNVVKVEHVSADQMATTVTPFVSPGGDVISFPRSNLVIITDIAKNADRLQELIRTFDTNTFAQMNAKIFKVEHAVLDDLAAELQSILEAYHTADSGAPAVLIPLTRLNAIAVIAHDRSVIMAVDYWVSVLDVEAEAGGRRQVYVYRVENSKAVDLADVLSEVYGDTGGAGSRGGRRARSGEAAESGLGLAGGLAGASSGGGGSSGSLGSRRSLGGSSGSSGFGGSSSSGGGLGSGGSSGGSLGGGSSGSLGGSSSSSTRGGRGGRAGGRAGATGGGAGGAGGVVLGGEGQTEIFEQEVRVVEDEITNSLVLLATPRDYETLRQVLRSLDIVPRQVLFEALIAEISLTEGDHLSIMQALQGTENKSSSNTDVTGKNGDQGGSYFDAFGRELRLIGTLGSGGLLGTVTAYRNGIEIYRGVLDAAANRGKAKILSRPNLMTSDNQEARLLVGQEVPILTTQSNSTVQTNSTTQILQSVQYRDTGLVIRALPQVNSEGLVNLELSLEVSEVAPGQSAGGIQSPTFTTRKAETSVVVNSGETLVIGGIIAEANNDDREGVPYLMDIPVLGRLFRSDTSSKRRTELIVLITPFVVRDRDEARSVTADFRRRVDTVLEDVEISETRDPAGHTLILEAPSAQIQAPPPPPSTHPAYPPPNGGPIPMDFPASHG